MVSAGWEDICASNSGKLENTLCQRDVMSSMADECVSDHIGRQFRHCLDQGLPNRVIPK